MLKSSIRVSVVALTVAAAAGCGQTTSDRAISGAGLGAAGGALGGAMVGAPATGALVGGAAGGAAGAFTDESDLDLGEPIWK